jgi:molybdopterin-guanine dinucleotide biosynthesis protein A
MKKIIEEAGEFDAVILKAGEYFEPLFSLYSKAFIKAAEACLEKGIYKVTAPLSMVKWRAVHVDPHEIPGLKKSLMNVNTPQDYEEAKKIEGVKVSQGTVP